MSKKLNLLIIFLIFAVPIALYQFMNMSSEVSTSANASMDRAKVLQFSSPMCYECKRLDKELKPIKPQYRNDISFQKIDISSRDKTTQYLIDKYDINVVPTLVFIDENGNIISKKEGYMTKTQLRNCLNSLR